MKWFFIFIFVVSLSSNGFCQNEATIYYDESEPTDEIEKFRIVKFGQYSEVDFNIVHFLNSHQILADEDFDELSVRVMSSKNTYSEDDFEHGATTSKIIIAVSEFDEAPTQNLFMIIPLFNPDVKKLENIDNYSALLTLEYGFHDVRETTTFRIELNEVVPQNQ